MDILPLVKEKDEYLRKYIEPVKDPESIRGALKSLSERLHETRIAHRAIGLAANQVGLNVRMLVMGNDFAHITCINPELVSVSDTEIPYTEGCLSFPDLSLKISRPETIQVKYLDEDLSLVECEFKYVWARCFLHELDHLNGVTFTDKVSKLVLAMARKKQANAHRFK